MAELAMGTRRSSDPESTSVGCSIRGNQGRLLKVEKAAICSM
jgi:hypothetical protein